jgi:hypothetical protein
LVGHGQQHFEVQQALAKVPFAQWMIRAQEMFKLALAMAVVDSYAAKFR